MTSLATSQPTPYTFTVHFFRYHHDPPFPSSFRYAGPYSLFVCADAGSPPPPPPLTGTASPRRRRSTSVKARFLAALHDLAARHRLDFHLPVHEGQEAGHAQPTTFAAPAVHRDTDPNTATATPTATPTPTLVSAAHRVHLFFGPRLVTTVLPYPVPSHVWPLTVQGAVAQADLDALPSGDEAFRAHLDWTRVLQCHVFAHLGDTTSAPWVAAAAAAADRGGLLLPSVVQHYQQGRHVRQHFDQQQQQQQQQSSSSPAHPSQTDDDAPQPHATDHDTNQPENEAALASPTIKSPVVAATATATAAATATALEPRAPCNRKATTPTTPTGPSRDGSVVSARSATVEDVPDRHFHPDATTATSYSPSTSSLSTSDLSGRQIDDSPTDEGVSGRTIAG